jgi:hypothetical protein
MIKASISFDDGLIEQFKWARGLYRCGIVGTFYINPAEIILNNPKNLSLDMLKRMKNEFGHTIANHLWTHECPRNGLTIESICCLYNKAKDWLTLNGFEDGANLLAITYGSEGGCWTKDKLDYILSNTNCIQIRDAKDDGYNDLDEKVILKAREDSNMKFLEDKLNLVYLHGNHNTTDEAFVNLLDRLKDVKTMSMKEIANVY